MESKGWVATLSIVFLGACSTVPEPKHVWVEFPKDVYFGTPKRKHKIIGRVRAKVVFPTLDEKNDTEKLCKNYFNHACDKLLKYAKEKKADAVIQTRSVVQELDGVEKEYSQAECVDEGSEGEVRAKGLAIVWTGPPLKAGRETGRETERESE